MIEWWMFLLLFLGALLFFLALGMPVAFAFLLVNLLFSMHVIGPSNGPQQLTLSMFRSLSTFTLSPIPFFILMGEIFFHSGIARRALGTMKLFLGRVPARQSLLAGAGGTLFSCLTGSTLANTALLGSLLVPEMRKEGYSKQLTVGPIVATGGLAMIIPPSTLAVLLGSVAHISIGRLLIGGLLPGLLMAGLYASYIIGRALLWPHEAPRGNDFSVGLGERVRGLVIEVLPLSLVIFVVIGFIVLGIATPTESAAFGAVGTVLLTFYFGDFDGAMVRKSLFGTLKITGMIMMIIVGSAGFSQLLSYTGASRMLVERVIGLDVTPVLILIAIQGLVLVLGTFMEQAAMIMLVTPLVMPIVHNLGLDPVWFGILLLLSLEVGLTSPPFGLINFVMKSVMEEDDDITLADIWMSALPFIVCDLIAMALLIAFPPVVTWLPSFIQ